MYRPKCLPWVANHTPILPMSECPPSSQQWAPEEWGRLVRGIRAHPACFCVDRVSFLASSWQPCQLSVFKIVGLESPLTPVSALLVCSCHAGSVECLSCRMRSLQLYKYSVMACKTKKCTYIYMIISFCSKNYLLHTYLMNACKTENGHSQIIHMGRWHWNAHWRLAWLWTM